MNSMKCPQCGLINWADAEACKRCKFPFVAPAPTEAPAEESAAEDAAGDAGQFAPHAAGPSDPHDGPAPWPPPHAHGSRPSSPYASAYESRQQQEDSALDIDFEVAPFVDVSTTLRDTYALSRSQFTLILKLVLLAIAPQIFLTLIVSGVAPSPDAMPGPGQFFGNTPRSTTGGVPDLTVIAGTLGLVALITFVSVFVRWAVMPGALVYGLVQTLRTGETPGVFECYRWGLRRSFTTGFSFLLTLLAVIAGVIMLIVPAFIFGTAFSLVLPIAAIEGVGVFETMGRSWRLTRGNRLTIFGASFCWTFLLGIIGLAGSVLIVIAATVTRSQVIGSLGVTVVTEVLSATHIVFALVVYLGIAHFGRYAAEGFYNEGGAAAGWGAQPAYAAPEPYAAPNYAAPNSYAAPQPYAVPHGYQHPHGFQQPHAYPQPKKSKAPIFAIVAACAIVMLSFVGIIAAIAIPNLLASRRAANEALAIKNLRLISSAEATFVSTAGAGSYGILDQLAAEKMIPRELASGEVSGYRYRVRVSGDRFQKFEVTATPVSSSTGTRSFYMCEDGVIRGADRKGLEASASDPPLEGSVLAPSRGTYNPRSAGTSSPGTYEPSDSDSDW